MAQHDDPHGLQHQPLPPGSRGWHIAAGMVPIRMPGRVGQAVVGESLCQGALRRIAGDRVADVSGGQFENAIHVTACLVPEPGNRDDPHAVAVTVGDELVGYLPADAASAWQPVLLRAWNAGRYVCCVGNVNGGGPGRSYGIFLTVCEPGEIEFVVGAPPGALPVIGSATVTVVGEDRHPGTLAPLRPHWPTAATLHLVPSTPDVDDAQATQAIEVRIDGKPVGSLTPAMSERYRDLVLQGLFSGLSVTCRAHVSEDERGKQVRLTLPSVREMAED
jgi:collagen type III alpha